MLINDDEVAGLSFPIARGHVMFSIAKKLSKFAGHGKIYM